MGYQISLNTTAPSITIDGYFNSLHASDTLGVNVFSVINSPDPATTAGLEWWWECVSQAAPHELTMSIDNNGNYLPRAISMVKATGATSFVRGNYHYRFVVKNGTEILKDKCRLYDPNSSGYDSNWDNQGYVPSWLNGTNFLFKSPVFNQSGIVQ